MSSPVSMRSLFGHPERPTTMVSLSHALSNHVTGTAGLREAHSTFTARRKVSGFGSGCRPPSASTINVVGITKREVGGVLPAWVDVVSNDHRARTLEGVLRKSKLTEEDFPLRPWHTSLDWNFFVQVDPQYAYLVSDASSKHMASKFADKPTNVIECEWESAFLPLWAVPQEPCRVWIMGRWIFDCGHPDENKEHRTEIHPPKAIVSFRPEAAFLPGNKTATPVTRATVYIGRRGGYIDQEINRPYAFDLHLPPKPHANAVPTFVVNPMTSTFPITPRIAPFPDVNPTLLRVVIPLDEAPRLDEYGFVVSGGWSDPTGAEGARVRHLRVALDRIRRTRVQASDKAGGPLPSGPIRTWHLHIGVNGRWHAVESKSLDQPLDIEIDLLLSDSDSIELSAFGIERRNIFGVLGAKTGIDPALASRFQPHEVREEALKEIADTFRDQILKHGPLLSDSNLALGLFSKSHPPRDRGTFSEDSLKNGGDFATNHAHNNYILEYRILEA